MRLREGYRILMGQSQYRRLYVLSLGASTLSAVLGIILPLWMKNKIGLSTSSVFAFLAAAALVGACANLGIGRLSDVVLAERGVARRGLCGIALLLSGAQGFIYLVFPTRFGFFLGVAVNQLSANTFVYALLRDYVSELHPAQTQEVTAAFRTSGACGFLIGPWLGLGILSFGYETVFVPYTAGCLLAAAGAWTLAPRMRATPGTDDHVWSRARDYSAKTKREPGWTATAALAVAAVLMLAASISTRSALTLDVTGASGRTALALVLSVSPVFEFAVFPIVPVLARRLGIRRTLLVGGALEVTYFTMLATARSVAMIVAAQAVGAAYGGVLFTVFMNHIQQTFGGAGRSGYGTAAYFSATTVGKVVGNTTLAWTLEIGGFRAGFGALGVLAVTGVGALALSTSRRIGGVQRTTQC